MARKEVTIPILEEDKELKFRIKQMPATKADQWITKAAILLSRGGAELPSGISQGLNSPQAMLQQSGGLQSLLALIGGLNYEDAQPLLEDLLNCCTYLRPDGKTEEMVSSSTLDGYISSQMTIFKLRLEALKLNWAFFEGAVNSAFQTSETQASSEA